MFYIIRDKVILIISKKKKTRFDNKKQLKEDREGVKWGLGFSH